MATIDVWKIYFYLNIIKDGASRTWQLLSEVGKKQAFKIANNIAHNILGKTMHSDDACSSTDELDEKNDDCFLSNELRIPMLRPPGSVTPIPRLLLSHLVLRDFKSYRGQYVIGPFDEHLTCFVGPSGSGKRSVLSALQFVLGRGISRIRAKEAIAFIHTAPPYFAKDCTVQLFFTKDTDHPVDRDASKFSVSRTAFANGQRSEYTINGERATRRQVNGLLKERGLDTANRQLILNPDEIQMLCSMKPKGQSPGEVGYLEFLEKVIGTHVLKAPLEKMQKILDDLHSEWEHKLNEVNDIKTKMCRIECDSSDCAKLLKESEEIANRRSSFARRFEALTEQRQRFFEGGLRSLEVCFNYAHSAFSVDSEAQLVSVCRGDPLAEGLHLRVFPPHISSNCKQSAGSWRVIAVLALVFAAHKLVPSPLYLLDGLDLILNASDMDLFSVYIKNKVRDAQFIVFSKGRLFDIASTVITNDMINKCSVTNTVQAPKLGLELDQVKNQMSDLQLEDMVSVDESTGFLGSQSKNMLSPYFTVD